MAQRFYKLLVIHDIEHQAPKGTITWAYGVRSAALKKYAPPDFEVSRMADADTHGGGWDRIVKSGVQLVFILDYALLNSYAKHLRKAGYRGRIVGSFNKDHRSRQQEWHGIHKAGADWIIVNNVDRWRHEGVRSRTCAISNGLDLDFWKSATPWAERPNRVIWTGGTGPAKRKGYHEVLVPLKPLLEADGFECDFRPVSDITPEQVKTPDEMLDWYNSARYVICASQTEGTPGFLLEAMTCGCVPFSTPVGNVPEMFPQVSQFVVPLEDLKSQAYLERILAIGERGGFWSDVMVNMMRKAWGYGPPANRADYFFQLFRRLIDDGPETIEPFNHWDVTPEEI